MIWHTVIGTQLVKILDQAFTLRNGPPAPLRPIPPGLSRTDIVYFSPDVKITLRRIVRRWRYIAGRRSDQSGGIPTAAGVTQRRPLRNLGEACYTPRGPR